MKLIFRLIISICMMFLLSGCLYPEERLKQNQIPYADQVAAVQSAVDQYREATGGLLPIQTRDMKTQIYQKYPIDFHRLVPRYMQEPPGNAFESGGVFQYVLVDVEKHPTVKLLDLRMAEQIRDVKLRLKMYQDSHGYPPFKDMLAKGIFTLDYKKLGYKEPPYVVSPFSGNNLPLIIDYNGEIYVDYRIDLYEALKKTKHSYKPGDDIRDILVKDSLFVPAYSLPYTIDPQKNEPIFLTK
ncbi:hypothetical protein [Thermaerobacillus caldiproteolyticus]|uniref:ABC transporter periplasmic binding protein yphF n=1 Tax=Thermaerobacillus caldiproteolyticus TaxID=247480 RepID=A0A7W0C013_9BACL|nr:hypothetical protein [Anoxybacillus caldiproteolyticus]MBA2875021.1 hypothetical protein [Anoxybacillus caldiproteolyticus]QPA32998.1 hypothetical protein ISX45_09065 [Anoxybacillus caldiproteolyticus]